MRKGFRKSVQNFYTPPISYYHKSFVILGIKQCSLVYLSAVDFNYTNGFFNISHTLTQIHIMINISIELFLFKTPHLLLILFTKLSYNNAIKFQLNFNFCFIECQTVNRTSYSIEQATTSADRYLDSEHQH